MAKRGQRWPAFRGWKRWHQMPNAEQARTLGAFRRDRDVCNCRPFHYAFGELWSRARWKNRYSQQRYCFEAHGVGVTGGPWKKGEQHVHSTCNNCGKEYTYKRPVR